MKITDDYQAKYKIWAKENRVVRMPRLEGLPPFGCIRFSTAEEMNAWKKSYLKKMIQSGNLKWKN